MDLSVIIPCYNEEKNVSLIINEFDKTFKEVNIKIEYIFVNDGSKDNTLAEIRKIIDSSNKTIKCLDFSRNFGKESAIYAGLVKSAGNYITIIDADLQQHPRYVLEMYNYIINNPEYDCITCYQKKRKEGKIKKFLKNTFYRLINKMCNIEFYKNASDFRLFNRTVANSLIEIKEYYRFSKGFFSWIGFNTYYMPYVVQERKYGKSSWSMLALFKYAIDGIIGFSIVPLKIATILGFISFLGSIIYLIVIVIQKITIGIAISGYPTIVCLILFFGGIQLIFAGILGEYLGRVYIETKRRPLFIIKNEYKTKGEADNHD